MDFLGYWHNPAIVVLSNIGQAEVAISVLDRNLAVLVVPLFNCFQFSDGLWGANLNCIYFHRTDRGIVAWRAVNMMRTSNDRVEI